MTNRPKRALLIIDIINDFAFPHGSLLLQHTTSIIKPILQIKQQFRHNNDPIIYVNDHYNLWQADFQKIITTCRNEKNTEIIDKISPDKDDFFLIKPKYSAFYGTALNTLLHHLNVTHLTITGIAGNICVLFTANDAYMREYTLSVPQNCLASASPQDNEYALLMMKHVLKADISPTQPT